MKSIKHFYWRRFKLMHRQVFIEEMMDMIHYFIDWLTHNRKKNRSLDIWVRFEE